MRLLLAREARAGGLLGACALLALGCASPSSADVITAFYQGRLDRAEQLLKPKIAENDASLALFLCEYGSILLARGAYADAYQVLLQANGIMEAFDASGREAAAIAGEEGHKIWRGEPYERSMDAYYLGLISYLQGDEDNARAGFKDALFQDAGSAEDPYRSDFSPALYLGGRLEARRGNREDAVKSFEEAKKRAPGNPFLADVDHLGNLLIVVDVGRGPEKVEAGAHGSTLAYFDRGGHSSGIPVHVDGEAGKTALIGDLFFQATTRGDRLVEKILHGKAVAREIGETGGLALLFAGLFGHGSNEGRTLAAAGAGLFGASQLLRSNADTRHWGSLPREVHVFAAQVSPGAHEVVIDLPVAGRVREEVMVEADRDRVLYYRAGVPFRRPEANQPPPSNVTRGESP